MANCDESSDKAMAKVKLEKKREKTHKFERRHPQTD